MRVRQIEKTAGVAEVPARYTHPNTVQLAEQTAKVDLDRAAPILTAGEVTQPVLLIHGRPDRFVPLDHSERLNERLPNSRLEVIEDRGHIPLMLDRDAVLEPLMPWLEELRTSPGHVALPRP